MTSIGKVVAFDGNYQSNKNGLFGRSLPEVDCMLARVLLKIVLHKSLVPIIRLVGPVNSFLPSLSSTSHSVLAECGIISSAFSCLLDQV